MAQTLIAPESVGEGVALRRWTREEYHRLAEVGILSEGAGTELIEGQTYLTMPQSKPHVAAIRYVFRALQKAYGEGFNVSMGIPLPLGEEGEPEPNVLVLRGIVETFEDRDPDPATEVALVVQVSVTSLAVDRTAKATL